MALSKLAHHAKKINSRFEGLKKKHEKVLKKGKEVVGDMVGTAEASASAFGMGIVRGKYGDVAPAGVPIGLGIGAVAKLVSWTGLLGELSPHVSRLGDGALCEEAANAGRNVGLKMGTKHVSGTRRGNEAAKGATQTDAEMAGNIRRQP